MNRPFMHWCGDPSLACWVSPHVPDGAVFTFARTDRDSAVAAPFIAFVTKKTVEPRVVGYDIIATPATWAELGAYNLAHAYRPRFLP